MIMMKVRPFLFFVLVSFLAAAAGTLAVAAPAAKPNVAPPPPEDREVCLQCHGPFEKLAAGPKSFAAEDGEKINPHLYVPHNRKDAQSVPVCTTCHRSHPIPLTSKKGLPAPNIDGCYTCHHTNEFKACGACH